MTAMTTITCKRDGCKKTKEVRSADVARGWGLYCSRACSDMDRSAKPCNPDYKFESGILTGCEKCPHCGSDDGYYTDVTMKYRQFRDFNNSEIGDAASNDGEHKNTLPRCQACKKVIR